MNLKLKKSSKKRVSDGERIAKLASLGETVFTVKDVVLLWRISNQTSLRVLLARYTKRGLLYRVWRGLYSLSDPKKIHSHILGLKIMHRYAYISCETVLFDAGIINQRPSEITMVSSVSKRFSLFGITYRSRKMRDSELYDSEGIIVQDGVLSATRERAKRDLSYFNSRKYYDANI